MSNGSLHKTPCKPLNPERERRTKVIISSAKLEKAETDLISSKTNYGLPNPLAYLDRVSSVSGYVEGRILSKVRGE